MATGASLLTGALPLRADAVSYFASEAAGFVTGQRLVVNGGRGIGL